MSLTNAELALFCKTEEIRALELARYPPSDTSLFEGMAKAYASVRKLLRCEEVEGDQTMRKAVVRWTMPEWMEDFEDVIGDRATVERRMCDPLSHHAVKALMAACFEERVRVLEELHERGMLKEEIKP